MDSTQPSSQPTYKIGILMLEGCNSLAMHAFVDPFRCANYLRSSNLYEWTFLGLDRETVVASNGASFAQLTPIGELSSPLDLLVINASWNVYR